MVDWKKVLVGATCLVGLAATAWASPERPYCSDWNEWWYHQLTTVGHIRCCINSGRVDINQVDENGQTLLHRLARDLEKELGDVFWLEAEDRPLERTSRKTRRSMVDELLR